MSHLFSVILVFFVLVILLAWVIWKLPNRPGLAVWIGGALSAFVDGFIDGCPVGAPAGAGIAFADGEVRASLDWHTVIVEIAHVLAVPFFTGLSDVRTFKKENAFPNVFLHAKTARLDQPGAHQ